MLNMLKFTFTAQDRTAAGFRSVKSELGGVKGALAGVQDYASRAGRAMRNIGAGMSAGVTTPLVLLGKQSIELYDQQVKAEQAVQQAILSTGGAANRTLEDLKGLASGLQGVTTFGDEDILRNVTAPLLTFTKVQDEVFDRAQANVLDMATLLKMDLRSASILVGKALNDPVKGVSALSRSGVQFSEDQKKVIKALVETGDIAAAQTLILKELETQFQGQAAAAASTPLGQFEQIKNAIGDIKEELGGQVAPFLGPLLDKVKEGVQWFGQLSPEVKKNIVVFGGLAAAVGPVLGVLGLATMGITSIAGALGTLGAVLLANPIGAAIALIAGGAYLIYRNWESISGWFSNLWDGVKNVTAAAWDGLKSLFLNYTAPGLIYQHWDQIGTWFTTQWDAVKGSVMIKWDQIKALLSGDYSVEALVYSAWRGIGAWFSDLSGEVSAAFVTIWEGIKAEVSSWPSRMLQVGKDVVNGLVSGLLGESGTVGSASRKLARDMIGGTKDELDSNSPSKVFIGIGKDVVDGLVGGLKANGARASDEIRAIAGQMTDVGQKASTELGGTFASAFTAIFMGTKKASDGLADLARQVTQMAMNKAFTSLFNSLFSSFPLFGGGTPAPVVANANGNAFASGRVVPFARGGVVSRATAFPMRGGMGVMGEAGPEAIMPLSRGPDGKLGVRASGGGSQAPVVNVNVAVENTSSGAQVRTVDEGGGNIRILVIDAVNEAISSGRADRTMRGRFGLVAQPQGV